MFKTVAWYLLEVAKKEVSCSNKVSMIKWKVCASEFNKLFLEEITKHTHGQYPFNQQIDKNTAAITWWQQMEGNEFAQILSVGTGNPWVSQRLHVLVPAQTRTRDPHGFTCHNKSKNSQNDQEMSEIQFILMDFTKSAVSHSVLGQKSVLGLILKATGMQVVTRTRTHWYRYP
ncbi:hypothetical protein B0H34DRAFT_679942 [Crassisporium funariophilum]|nr:hypothetical protein B0H34DRAFT_679942 [Crassisporium funariophilum]